MFSTEAFSGEGTGRLIVPILKALLPGAAESTVATLHGIVRKIAHIAEFTLLAVLVGRALRRPGRSSSWVAWRVLALCGAWAAVDEIHQAFVPTRVGAVEDIALDLLGVMIGIATAAATQAKFSSGRRSPT